MAYITNLKALCKKAQQGLHLLKEKDSLNVFRDMFHNIPVSDETKINNTISRQDLADLLMDLVSQFSKMQQAKLTDERLEAMLLIKSPFTLNQSYKVVKQLL